MNLEPMMFIKFQKILEIRKTFIIFLLYNLEM